MIFIKNGWLNITRQQNQRVGKMSASMPFALNPCENGFSVIRL